jgi:hypothetical protein
MPILAALLLSLAAAQTQDGQTPFSFADANYQFVPPKGWVRIKNPADFYQISLIKVGNFVGVSGVETDATAEAILKTIEDGQKQQAETYRSLGKAHAKVAGIRALQVRGLLKREGLTMTMIATIFAHQGCAYRIIGVHVAGDFASFEEDYQSILTSFAFLGERKDWLERFEGKPARTAFLGGLCSFELNRPRWKESTLQATQDYGFLEHLTFAFMGQAAWVTLRGRLSSGSAESELGRLREDLAGRLKKAVVQPSAIKTRNGEVRAFEVTGQFGGEEYFIRAAVLVEDGVAVDFWLEGYERQKEALVRDWEQLVAGIGLQSRSKPVTPPAYPLHSWDSWRSPSAALSTVFRRATRIATTGGQVAAVSPDGSRVLLVGRESGNVFVEAATGKRHKAAFEPAATVGARWSKDGKRLLWPGDEGLCVATVDPPQVRTLGVRAAGGAFGDALGGYYACASDRDQLGAPVSRLEWVSDKDERRVLVDFPLSRVSLPELSPDGTQLALVSNRDYPRTARSGGHLYVGAPDGSKLRQLTRGWEEILHLCWASDGRALYIVRRMAQGPGGAVGIGGRSDLWRVPLDGGEARNLTRSDHIEGVWVAGEDLLVSVGGYRLPEAQQGLFRIAPEILEKAASELPEFPPADAAVQGKAVANQVRAALGGGAIRDVVPTPENLAAAAKAFAEAARAAVGVTLDFSVKSLDELPELVSTLNLRDGDPALVLGLGAYYGETLRTAAGAEWMLQPVPLGDASPALSREGTPLADPVFPFTDVVSQMLGSEDGALRSASMMAQQDEGRRIILVHPPSYAEEAVRRATGPEYFEARAKLDAGELRPAFELLAKELERRPKNRTLAREVVGWLDAARMEKEAKELIRKAVEAGNEVPELLMRYAEDRADDPARALEALRLAASGSYPPAAALLRLGKAYAAAGERPLAEACWRHAFSRATPVQQSEIHSLMGTRKSTDSDE